MTNQQQYEQTWDMRKKYEKIVEIVKDCEKERIEERPLSKEAPIIAYVGIKEIIGEDLK